MMNTYYLGSNPFHEKRHESDEKVLPVDEEGKCWCTQGLQRQGHSALPMEIGLRVH